ncbi:FKBP-type peptidyl-prolyl cis-trans isomerase [Dysgonomonas macrotermitis]|uniref:peptidylprolyl isomerase n=1 Tax=Dysgonomonas macrotermitis TaxID=1346286 RepID=A0A1M5CFL6_9BACT|nr:FKBP-type peptidyl-prolyl cis-trans isomerase [Dysgonomonas macrotermitis]SHF53499.1 FKBP-type peptidyl-prolyl cis-trans isomerase FklB [Dysgonomonas macrotermitis]
MKRITLSVLFLVAVSSFGVYAQKKEKNKKSDKQEVATTVAPLVSKSDTLAYAFGVSLAENGLVQYLQQLGVVSDTNAIYGDYNSRIEATADEDEKIRLKNELTAKMDSITAADNSNLEQLLRGIREKLETKDVNKAYTTGLEVGGQLLNVSGRFSEQAFAGTDEKLNNAVLFEGVKDYLSKNSLRVEDSKHIVDSRMADMTAKVNEEKKKEYAEVIAAGERFMAENAKKEGVVTLEDGLQYKILTEGNGPKPTVSNEVKVHYKGTFIDGTVFDSSIDRGEPITFALTGVIQGWTEVLQLMPVGSKWEVYIPYNLAYGDVDRGTIKPYSNLIFEIELLEIVK